MWGACSRRGCVAGGYTGGSGSGVGNGDGGVWLEFSPERCSRVCVTGGGRGGVEGE